jgi:hypothetical protein
VLENKLRGCECGSAVVREVKCAVEEIIPCRSYSSFLNCNYANRFAARALARAATSPRSRGAAEVDRDAISSRADAVMSCTARSNASVRLEVEEWANITAHGRSFCSAREQPLLSKLPMQENILRH